MEIKKKLTKGRLIGLIVLLIFEAISFYNATTWKEFFTTNLAGLLLLALIVPFWHIGDDEPTSVREGMVGMHILTLALAATLIKYFFF